MGELGQELGRLFDMVKGATDARSTARVLEEFREQEDLRLAVKLS